MRRLTAASRVPSYDQGAVKCASSSFCVLTHDVAYSLHTFSVVATSPGDNTERFQMHRSDGSDAKNAPSAVMELWQRWTQGCARLTLWTQRNLRCDTSCHVDPCRSCQAPSSRGPMQSAHAPTCGGGGTSAANSGCPAAASRLAPIPSNVRLQKVVHDGLPSARCRSWRKKQCCTYQAPMLQLWHDAWTSELTCSMPLMSSRGCG